MPGVEIELTSVDFVTIGTIGPKGKRVFYLQAGAPDQTISLIIEKEQSWALSEAINEFMADLEKQAESPPIEDRSPINMQLREPVEPLFRVAQMGLGYDEEQDKIILIAQELLVPERDSDDVDTLDELIESALADEEPEEIEEKPSIIRLWCSRRQIVALSQRAIVTVESGRADPKQNGRLVYYWT
jgi:uncharacterized repeat protein (TIGR03847 family)